MSKKFIFYTVIISIVTLFIIIQSVVFPLFFTNDYMPDLSLIAIVYFSINYGKSLGQSLGFISGLVIDSLSGVPFGLNSMVRLIMGFFLGFFEGKIFLDKVVLPVVIILICTIMKFVLIILIAVIFPIELKVNFLSYRYLIEIGMNIVIAPFIFILFDMLAKRLYPDRVRVS